MSTGSRRHWQQRNSTRGTTARTVSVISPYLFHSKDAQMKEEEEEKEEE